MATCLWCGETSEVEGMHLVGKRAHNFVTQEQFETRDAAARVGYDPKSFRNKQLNERRTKQKSEIAIMVEA